MAFADNSRVNPTIFFIEKISFSLKFFSGDFYGQSFIKTVPGPFNWQLVSFEIVLGDHINDNITWSTDIGIALAKSYFSLQHRVLFYNAYTNFHFGCCCVIWANWLYSNVHKIRKNTEETLQIDAWLGLYIFG